MNEVAALAYTDFVKARAARRRSGSRRRGRCGCSGGRPAGSILRRRLATWARRTWRSSSYSTPQTSTSRARWVISRPRLRASVAQQLELGRGQVDRLAVAAHARGRRGRSRGPSATIVGSAASGLARRSTASQPGDQLRRAERLGHVVVGAGGQRPHLRLLLADRGEDDDRHLAPLAQPLGHLDAVDVGQHQVEDRRRRRFHRGAVERLLAAARRSPPRSRRRAGSPSARGGSAARRRRRGSAGGVAHAAASRAAAKRDDEAACPGRAATRPRSRRRWPRRSPWRSPGRGRSRPPAPSPRRARTARRSARHSLSGMPGPWSTTRTTILPPTSRERDQHRPAAAVADRVLEQVGEGALELGGVGVDQSAARRRAPAAPARGRRRSRRGPPRAPRRGRPARGAARPCPPPAATCRAGSRPGARAARPRRRPPRSARARSSAVERRPSRAPRRRR